MKMFIVMNVGSRYVKLVDVVVIALVNAAVALIQIQRLSKMKTDKEWVELLKAKLSKEELSDFYEFLDGHSTDYFMKELKKVNSEEGEK